MMNTLVTLISVAALVAASPSGGSKRLNARSDYCGTDRMPLLLSIYSMCH